MADSKLSSEQVLARSFDPTTDKLKVDAEVTATVGQMEVAIDAQGGDSIAIKNSVTGNELDIEADGSINVNVNVSAAGGDTIAVSDGTDILAINANGSINIENSDIAGINSKVSTLSEQEAQTVHLASIDSKLIQSIVINAINSTAFNLLSSAYSVTSALSEDYLLNHIEFNFSSTQSRDITITLANGTKLWEAIADTSQNIVLSDIDIACNGGDNFTIAITQTAGACLVDVLATVKQGDAPLLSSGSIVQGYNDSGVRTDLSMTAEGHAEVAIHAPRLPFGSVHVENLTPIFQADAVYGLNTGQVEYSSALSGSVSGTNSVFKVSTGTTIYSQAQLQSRKRLRYRAGQGVVGRFTAIYSTPATNSYQVAGFGHAEDGLYFGYKDTQFGILYSRKGVREVQTLTINTASTTAENVTVTLNGVAFSVAVTNNNNVNRTAYEISRGAYTGWKAYPKDGTVVFVADSVGNKAGSFSLSGTTAAGTFVETKTGVAATETFIPQSTWNGDKLDGTGASGVTLDPLKGNVFQIGIQYLGFGSFIFSVEVSKEGNNPDFVVCHTINNPNTLTATSLGNPSFPFTMAVYSAGSTTDLSITVGSFAGFVEGAKVLQGNRFSYFNSTTAGNSTDYRALFTIQNPRYYAGRSNQAVINLLSVSAALKHTQPAVFYLVRNATLSGNVNFQELSNISCSLWDTAATTISWSSGEQLVWTGHLGETGEIDHHFGNGSFNAEELTLQPGEMITLAVRSVANNIAYATGAINTREDQ